MKTRRSILTQIRNRALAPKQPNGLLSPAVLVAGRSSARRIHRKLLWSTSPGRNRALGLMLFAWRWSRWVSYIARQRVAVAVTRFGESTETAHGITIGEQRRTLLRHAIVHGISPLDFYQLGLFEPARHKSKWCYVFECEASAFHRGRDRANGNEWTHSCLLGDKVAAALAFAEAGISVPPTLVVLARGTSPQMLPETGGQVFFCKPCVGAGALGVFRMQREGEVLRAWTLSGQEIEHERVDRWVGHWLGRFDYLVQPYVGSHEGLHVLGRSRYEAATLRLISEQEPHSPMTYRVYCAYLEIPVEWTEDNGSQRKGYASAAVDSATGVIGQILNQADFLPSDVIADLYSAAVGLTVPGWDSLRDQAFIAHQQVPEHFAIAWDFIVSPDGPVLLEGNATWSLAAPQLIKGPLLLGRSRGDS